MRPAQVAKAIAAAATAAGTALGTAAADDGVSVAELVVVLLGAVAAAAVVFAVPNEAPPGTGARRAG